MIKKSAGILLFRFVANAPEFLLVHPGGPFWVNKDSGSWSIPKGEFSDDENPLEAAKRETKEELGINVSGDFLNLSPVRQKSGKTIYAWALQHDFDESQLVCNTFELEWPPKSGNMRLFPEVDRAEWFGIHQAKEKIISGQIPLIDELTAFLIK